MKVKPSPTSPKATAKGELDQLYAADGLKRIDQPIGRKVGWRVIVMALIFGAFGGVFGLIGLNELFGRTGLPSFLFQSLDSSQSIIRRDGRATGIVPRATEQLDASLVAIFVRKEPSTVLTEQAYRPEDRAGVAAIVTADGWAVAHRSTFTDLKQSYVAVTSDRRILDVGSVLRDPLTDTYFFKLDATGLSAVEFEPSETIDSGQEVLVAETNAPRLSRYSLAVLTDSDERRGLSAGLVETSETLSRRYVVRPATSDALGAAVATLDGKIIGFVDERSDGELLVRPGSHVRTAVASLLRHGAIKRNVLGVRLIDLAASLNLPTSLTQTRQRGAVLVADPAGPAAIQASSPAATAELVAGDIILKVGPEEVNQRQLLAELIQSYELGATVDLRVLNADGDERTVTVTFDTVQ